MTYLEAAFEVLKSSSSPLSTREITERAMQRQLIAPHSKTPVASMAAALYQALRADDHLLKLEDPGRHRARRGTVRWTLSKGRDVT